MGSQDSNAGQMWNWFPLPRIEVFTSRKKARKFHKALTGEESMRFLDKASQVSYFAGSRRDDIAILVFDEAQFADTSFSQRVAMVAHECSHVVDDFADSIGEDRLGTETRAYLLDSAVASVVEQLGEAWFARKEERR